VLSNVGQGVDHKLVVPSCDHSQVLTLLLGQRSVEVALGRLGSTGGTDVAVVAVVLTWNGRECIKLPFKLPSVSRLTFWDISQAQAVDVKASIALHTVKHFVVLLLPTLVASFAV
jgi:hypothetical protein